MRLGSPLLACFVVACASGGGDELRTELSRLRQEVYALRTDLRHTREDYRALRTEVETLKQAPSVPRKPRKPTAAAASDPEPPALPVVKLTSDGKPVPVEEQMGAIDDGSPPILIKMGPGVPEKLEVDEEVLETPDPVLGGAANAPETPKAQYEIALETLRRQRDPVRAKALLAAFERKHPRSPLADNAAYWTGEAHFMLAEYAEAAQTFVRLMDAYPDSAKEPWAMLRLGESLYQLARAEEAIAKLEALIRRFPDSPPARTARERLALWRADQKGKM